MKIDKYNFGVMVVNGRRFTRDLIITPTRIIRGWWRAEGHRLTLNDLRDILNEDFEVLIIGTGYSGLMKVDEEVVTTFKNKGVKVIVKPTREAVNEYNKLVGLGKKVVGAFHLTC